MMLPTILAAACVAATAHADVQRPPQFVVVAFDNCTELERWEELSDFAAAMNKEGDRVHFTFFVSGTNFIADANRTIYEAPHQRRGYSRINFGGSADHVRARVTAINDLHRHGHEIASHAVGHFDGRSWTASAWANEFDSFDHAFRKVAANNRLSDMAGFSFPASAIVGFRAPYLATSPGLYAVLKERGFRYDTSGDAKADAWPVKEGGLWRFNLANIRINGSGRKVLSMDYNFLVAQSFGFADRRNAERHGRQMLLTYLDYFKANYAGNRAPIHIGHHFTDYQAGAYRHALKSFARMVCGLPEVRCVTYRALADFMDGVDAPTLLAYRAGGFPRAAEPALALTGEQETPLAAATDRRRNN